MKTINQFLIDWTRVNSDVNGNPRYVCHFLELANDYNEALKLAKTIGGKKYHNKQYGGGIVFQSYNLDDETKQILVLSKRAIICHRAPTAHEIKKGLNIIRYNAFLKEDITKRDGNIKKFFKAEDGLYYSTK